MANIFLNSFGFSENPFSSTNADREPNLAQYFVPPPYFASVKGDPRAPKSNVILAPRGGGKTAQKVMLEEFAEREHSQPVYCITYDSFRAVNASRMALITSDWHLTQIIQRTLAGIVASINSGHGGALSGSDKRVLTYCFKKFLGTLTSADAHQAFSSVKSIPERVMGFWLRTEVT